MMGRRTTFPSIVNGAPTNKQKRIQMLRKNKEMRMPLRRFQPGPKKAKSLKGRQDH
jgi:hypothetical protein